MKLNQVIAIESGVKSKTNATVSEIYKAVQHTALFDGFSKQYRPLKEGEDMFPPENKKVQRNALQSVKEVAKSLGELFDVTAIKDYGNMQATADVVVDGQTLVTKAPVTYLLFLEKTLTDVHTFVSKLPVLDPAEDWKFDPNNNMYRTNPETTIRTKKVQEPIVLYDATPEHPAQCQLITKDVTVGNWEQTKFSGAMQAPEKEKLLARVEKLQKAVKFAREEANGIQVGDQAIGEKVFGWILS